MREDRTKDNLRMLDDIDFSMFFEESTIRVADLMSKVEDYYNKSDFVDNDVMNGFVFNWVGVSELCDYLEERYPNFKHYEVSVEYCYIDD